MAYIFITKGKTNWKYLLIVFILGLIVGAATLWLSAKLEFPPIEFPEIKRLEKIEIETANWKTYRNEIFKFEIKYPSDWQTREYSPGRQWHLPEEKRTWIISFASNQESLIAEKGVNIFVVPTELSNDFYLLSQELCKACSEIQDVCKKEKITVKNIQDLIQKEEIIYHCFFSTKEEKEFHFLVISQVFFKFYTPVEQSEIFDQMLSTFRFLE